MISGLVLLALAFISCAVSLVAPYWIITNHDIESKLGGGEAVLNNVVGAMGGGSVTQHNYGLWAHCTDINDPENCNWFFLNDFKWEKNLPVWWQASQALFAFGVLLILIAFLTACVFLCSACCKSFFSVVHLINGLLVLAFISLAISLSLWGYKAYDEHKITYDWNEPNYFYWGFWAGCGGALLDLLAILFYSCEGCRGGHPDGYSRGEVV